MLAEFPGQPLVVRPHALVDGEQRGQEVRDRLGRVEPRFEVETEAPVLRGAVVRVDVGIQRAPREVAALRRRQLLLLADEAGDLAAALVDDGANVRERVPVPFRLGTDRSVCAEAVDG